jgi:alanine or glycine:cation symporter, AGCS family
MCSNIFSAFLSQSNLTVNGGIDDKINSLIKPAVDALGEVIFYKPFSSFGFEMPLVVLWLILGAVFFTFYMRFINLTGIKHAIDLIRGRYDKPGDKGEVTHFQALVTALSGTVGLGNIAGVAVAISIGGPGATFWMIVAGFFGMASKFVECTLGVKYRKINSKGEVSGGPMYYLSEGLGRRGMPKLGRFLAGSFAFLCIGGSLGGGNMFQANQSFAQLAEVFPVFKGFGFVFGILLALLVGIVIIGGIKKIASVTDKVVPFMVALYVITSLYIIFVNIDHVGDAFLAIYNGAFSGDGIVGGAIGVMIVGFKRAAFSNEAGVGSAAIAHSAVKTDHPISEGLVSLFEPFIDTIVICTMTALVLVFTGFATNTNGIEGSALTSAAFSSVVPWFKYILLISILLFAFSTMIAWSYYGMKSFTFLFGNTKKMENLFKFIYLGFVVIGSSASLSAVMDFSDMMILAMGFPNILGLYFMASEVKTDLKSYLGKVKSGEIARH